MNFPRVALLGLLLSAPALWGLWTGSVDPDAAGLRLGIALVVAGVVDRIARVFVSAAAPVPVASEPDADAEPPAGVPARSG